MPIFRKLINLEYWSDKASKFAGEEEFNNLIIALADHQKCERAWQILSENYPDLKDFPFYGSTGKVEVINGKCKRQL